MKIESVLAQFKEKVNEKVAVIERGTNRYTIITPFIFEDGDSIVIILKYNAELKSWYLTDEEHTFFHLGYFIDEKDMFSGTRQMIIDNALSMYGISNKAGELIKVVEEDKFGDALYDFVQSLMKINDVTYLDRERVRSTFYEDFQVSMRQIATKRKIEVRFNVYDKSDIKKEYPIDCIIITKKQPVFLFAIHNDNKCKDATITIYEFHRRAIDFHPIAIFENQEGISSKTLARFTVTCDKLIPSLSYVEEVDKYLMNYHLI
jgi:hypothetical protein